MKKLIASFATVAVLSLPTSLFAVDLVESLLKNMKPTGDNDYQIIVTNNSSQTVKNIPELGDLATDETKEIMVNYHKVFKWSSEALANTPDSHLLAGATAIAGNTPFSVGWEKLVDIIDADGASTTKKLNVLFKYCLQPKCKDDETVESTQGYAHLIFADIEEASADEGATESTEEEVPAE